MLSHCLTTASISINRVLQTASDIPQPFPYLEEKNGKKSRIIN